MSEEPMKTEEGLDSTAQKLVEEKEADSHTRVYAGAMDKSLTTLLIIWAVFQIWSNTFGAFGTSAFTLKRVIKALVWDSNGILGTGAVGFVMAAFMCVSCTKVMLAAAIPAFLYYLTVIYSVHLEAKRLGLSGLSPENIPKAGRVLRERGHLLLLLVVLPGLMFSGFTPLFAASAQPR